MSTTPPAQPPERDLRVTVHIDLTADYIHDRAIAYLVQEMIERGQKQAPASRISNFTIARIEVDPL